MPSYDGDRTCHRFSGGCPLGARGWKPASKRLVLSDPLQAEFSGAKTLQLSGVLERIKRISTGASALKTELFAGAAARAIVWRGPII